MSLMEAYSNYNHIKMDLMDMPKTTFMSNHGNYYYNVLPGSRCHLLETHGGGVLKIDRAQPGSIY